MTLDGELRRCSHVNPWVLLTLPTPQASITGPGKDRQTFCNCEPGKDSVTVVVWVTEGEAESSFWRRLSSSLTLFLKPISGICLTEYGTGESSLVTAASGAGSALGCLILVWSPAFGSPDPAGLGAA